MHEPPFPTRVGSLRPSQLLHTFGVGAIVDLPNISAVIMGLDDWDTANMREIGEERLLAAVRDRLGDQVQRLSSPPMSEDLQDLGSPFDAENLVGVPVAVFPRWLRCPQCNLLARVDSDLFQLKTHQFSPDRTRYVHSNCPMSRKPPAALPVRFLVSCRRGHLDDFPWIGFVHDGQACQSPQLRLEEYGVSGQPSDVWVKCTTCGMRKPMSAAFGEEGKRVMPPCRGRRPHLRDFDEAGCDEHMRTLLLGASNSWFPVILSSLHIPRQESRLGQLVEGSWHLLGDAGTLDELKYGIKLLGKEGKLGGLAEFSAEDIWFAVEERRRETEQAEETPTFTNLKSPEWELLSDPESAPSSSEFRLRIRDIPSNYEDYFAKVVLVDRLREVKALTGFTRIESPGDFDDLGEIPPHIEVARLSRKDPTWIPAAETRGEGLFIQFNEEAIEAWSRRSEIRSRAAAFFVAHKQWRTKRSLVPPEKGFPGSRFILLHSFAHALMRQLAIECGYTSASIRERIYSANPESDIGPMAGVLLYTAAPDSEGTLGGLVGLGEGKMLGYHLDQALLQMRLCSSDPLCAERVPDPEGNNLHGAACHACLFSAETSCERGNKYLDRSFLVETVGQSGCAFFR